MITYKKTNGMAHDLQFKEIPDPDDIIFPGDELPDIETLHDPSYVAERDKSLAEEQTKKNLTEIDIKSIRSIREMLAKMPDAPQFLKDYETQAIAERAKLKQG